jgi:outer membrane protein TolC
MIESNGHLELRNIFIEATLALAHLDSDRLEQMRLSCAALVRDDAAGDGARTSLYSGCTDAWMEMATFMRVLEATKANLDVLRRLREIRNAQLEYGSISGRGDYSPDGDHGDH